MEKESRGLSEKTLKNGGDKLLGFIGEHGMGIAIIYYNNQ
jgi:hypothetical protein